MKIRQDKLSEHINKILTKRFLNRRTFKNKLKRMGYKVTADEDM